MQCAQGTSSGSTRRASPRCCTTTSIAGEHTKNYSLLLSGSQVRLAPLYDIASALPYDLDVKRLQLAMKIGGEYRLHLVGVRKWHKLAADRAATCRQWLAMH